jgi:hypothetical protein
MAETGADVERFRSASGQHFTQRQNVGVGKVGDMKVVADGAVPSAVGSQPTATSLAHRFRNVEIKHGWLRHDLARATFCLKPFALPKADIIRLALAWA